MPRPSPRVRLVRLVAVTAIVPIVVGCAAQAEPSRTDDGGQAARPSAAITSSPLEADMTTEIEVIKGEVMPPPGRLELRQGDLIRIEVISDEPDTVHVHGYDVEEQVRPSAPAVLEFTVDQPGLFEVETHESGLLLTQLVVA